MKRAFRTLLLALFALAFAQTNISGSLSVTQYFSVRQLCRFTTSRFVGETGFYGFPVIGPTIRTMATTGFPGPGLKHPTRIPRGGDGKTEAFSSSEVGFYGALTTASAILATLLRRTVGWRSLLRRPRILNVNETWSATITRRSSTTLR